MHFHFFPGPFELLAIGLICIGPLCVGVVIAVVILLSRDKRNRPD